MSEVLFMASVLLLLIGAMGFYFYSRIAYTEKKLNLLETILLDIKMMIEMEDLSPISQALKYDGASKQVSTQETQPVEILEPVNLEKNDVEELKDETEYYNSVIESVASESSPDTNQVSNTVSAVNYDTLSKEELTALAEKRNLKLTKRMARQAVVNLLRESDKNTSGLVELGKDESPTGPFTSMDTRGAPLDMETVEEVRL